MHKAELTARHNLEQALLTNQAEKQLIRNVALRGLMDVNSNSLRHRTAKSAKGNKTPIGQSSWESSHVFWSHLP